MKKPKVVRAWAVYLNGEIVRKFGYGGSPCLWESRKEAIYECDCYTEEVVQVEIRPLKPRKRKP